MPDFAKKTIKSSSSVSAAKKSAKPIQSTEMTETAPDLSNPVEISAENILRLQRTLGNQRTQSLLAQAPTARGVSGNFLQLGRQKPSQIQRVGYEASVSDDDDMVVPEQLTEEEQIQDALNSIEKGTFGGVTQTNLTSKIVKLLVEKVLAADEGVLTDNQYDFVIEHIGAEEQKKLVDSEKAPKLMDAISKYQSEDAKKKRILDEALRKEFYTVETAFEYAQQSPSGVDQISGKQALTAQQIYYKEGRFSQIDKVVDNYASFKKTVETPALAWIMSKKNKTAGDMEAAIITQIDASNKKQAMENKEKDPLGKTISGIGTVTELTSMGFSVQQGSQSVSKIKEAMSSVDGADAGKLFGESSNILESMAMWIIGKVFGALSIGTDLVKAFRHHKTRRDGYRAAMDRSGINFKGETEIKPDSKENKEKYRLGRVAYYAWKKTSRAFMGTIMKAVLKFVKWISHAITLITGGASALVTESIALAADVARAAKVVFDKIKGFGKLVMGKRGLNRKLNATELLNLAIEGDDSAIKTIMDVYPFDTAFNRIPKKGVKKVFGAGQMLPPPASADEFKKELKNGHYKDPKVRKALINALANTMKSK